MDELRDSARQVLDGLGPAAPEASSWPVLAELGWLMVAVPEELGGLGMGPAGTCALCTELGRSLGTIPFIPAMLSIDAVCRSELADREARLERMMSGQDYVAVPMADGQLSAATGDDGRSRLTGRAMAVPSADTANHLLACTADGAYLGLVSLEGPEVELVERPTWDRTRRLFDVVLSGAAVDDDLTLATGQQAQRVAARLATLRDFTLAAESVGGADALLEMTVEYLGTREQFGRPLALFQALKHRCADLKAQTEAARALLLDNLDRLESGGEEGEGAGDAGRLGRTARLLACEAYAAVAEEAVQLHGGIAMSEEHSCHLYLKRAMLNEHLGRQAASYDLALATPFFE